MRNYPQLRDNDNALMLNIWALEKPELKGMNFVEFGYLLRDGKLTNPESIRRCRQKIQEEFPELRGKVYKVRKSKQSIIKEELKQPEFKKGGTP